MPDLLRPLAGPSVDYQALKAKVGAVAYRELPYDVAQQRLSELERRTTVHLDEGPSLRTAKRFSALHGLGIDYMKTFLEVLGKAPEESKPQVVATFFGSEALAQRSAMRQVLNRARLGLAKKTLE